MKLKNPLKDNITTEKEDIKKTLSLPLIKDIGLQIIYTIMGFLCSRSCILGGYSPFSSALLAITPIKNILACTAGAIIGCFFPAEINTSFRYVAALLAIVAIRWILNDIHIIKNHTVFNIIISALPLFATGVAMSFTSSGLDIAILIMYLSEAIICGATAYFFKKAYDTAYSKTGVYTLTQQNLACVILSFLILTLSFTNVIIYNISIGRVIAIFSVMLCAYFGSVSGGAVSGIGAGILFGLEKASFSPICITYALGGLISGIFSSFGKISVVVAFLLSNLTFAFDINSTSELLSTIYEIALSGLIFLIIPTKYLSGLKIFFDMGISEKSFETMKKNIMMKLNFSSKALSGVTQSIDNVATKIEHMETNDKNEIHKKVASCICNNCGIKQICWKKERDCTTSIFKYIETQVKLGQSVENIELPEDFYKRCARVNKIISATQYEYNRINKHLYISRQIAQVRSIINNQLYTMGGMLDDLSNSIEVFGKFFPKQSDMIMKLFKENNINAINVVCRTDINNHMLVEAQICSDILALAINKKIFPEIERICACKMDKPLINTTNGITRLQLCQKPNFELHYALSQHICNNQRLCGDSFKCFNDGEGHTVFILSDGMGSGGMAAVDASMASGISSNLIKSGLKYESALRIVNCALSVKSPNESFATLDIAVVDMFSGKVEFIKAGAVTSFIRKGKSVVKIDNPGLPVGILNEVEFSKTTIFLDSDDVIVMVSDGAVAFDEKCLEKRLKLWDGENEQDFANELVLEAKKRREGEKDDDISCVVITLGENYPETIQ